MPANALVPAQVGPGQDTWGESIERFSSSEGDLHTTLFRPLGASCTRPSRPGGPLAALNTTERAMAALRKKLRAIFDELDADKSGYISTDEMQAICKKLKLDIKPAALKQLIKEADPDGSGQIDFDEFVGALKKQMAKRKAGGASSGRSTSRRSRWSRAASAGSTR